MELTDDCLVVKVDWNELRKIEKIDESPFPTVTIDCVDPKEFYLVTVDNGKVIDCVKGRIE